MKLIYENNPYDFSHWVIFQEDNGTQFLPLNLEWLEDIKYTPSLTEWLCNGVNNGETQPNMQLSFTNEEVVNEVVCMFRSDPNHTTEREAFLQEQLITIVNRMFPD